MKRRDVAAAIAAIVLLAVSLHLFVLDPLRREHAKARARQRMELAIRSGDPMVSVRAARASLEDLDRYRMPMSSDVETQMDRAAAYMLMANYPAAIKEYEAALRLEKRPEIYLQLGEALTAAGRPEEGVQALLRAVLFNRALLEEISDGIARQRVEAELAAIQKRGGPCSGIGL